MALTFAVLLLIPLLNVVLATERDPKSFIFNNPWQHDPRSPGILDLLSTNLKPVSNVVYIKKFNSDRKDDDSCGALGVSVGESCLEYVSTRMSFNNARSNCRGKGGDLWVPDLDDPLLWEHLFVDFPRLFGAHLKDVFIGLGRTGSRYTGVDGVDYTNNPLVLSGRNMANTCFALRFDQGAFYLNGVPLCATNNQFFFGDFVCQHRRPNKFRKA